MNTDVIQQDANGEDGEGADYGQHIYIVAGILSNTIHGVSPQPLAHRVAVGVYAEHAEGTGTDGIDDSALLDMQILEIHKRANGGCYCQQLVGVCHPPVGSQWDMECLT